MRRIKPNYRIPRAGGVKEVHSPPCIPGVTDTRYRLTQVISYYEVLRIYFMLGSQDT